MLPNQHQHLHNQHLKQQNINNTPSSSTPLSRTAPKTRRDDLTVKPAKSFLSSSSRAPKPQRKHNLKAITEHYNRFHTLDEINSVDYPNTKQESSSHSPT